MSEMIRCESCQKEYNWKPELAGKRGKCKCGAVVEFPAEIQQPEQDNLGIYDVSEAEPTPPAATIPSALSTPAARLQTPSPVLGYAPPPLPGQMGLGLRKLKACQACGKQAPTRYVEFHQNIGALVMRFRRSIKGELCKGCIHSNFWSMTMTTLCIGWLGTISIIIAPFMVINNIVRYASCIGLPREYSETERNSV